MPLTSEEVAALSEGQAVIYTDPSFGIVHNGVVRINDGETLFIDLEEGHGVQFVLPNCPDGISELSLPEKA